MAYFFILPLWILALLGMTALVLASRTVRGWNAVYPYAWRVLLWSSIGFVMANAVLWLALAAILSGPPHPDGAHPLDVALQLIAGLGLILGPVLASAVGFGGGALAGVLLARSRAATRP